MISRRRLTWIAHNAVMTVFLPLRVALWTIVLIGEAADRTIAHLPGWRRYNGWSGW